MSVREVGSYIGYNRVTSTSQDSASGIWSLAAAERRKRAAAWPKPGDPDFASVSLLLHMDGSNGSTTFTDSSGSPKTVTASGNAQISTAQSKFGGASGLFDGSGDWLSAATIPNIGTSDFVIEWWMRIADVSVYQHIIGTSTNGNFMIALLAPFNGAGAIGMGRNNVAWDFVRNASLSNNTWHYCALSRDGGTMQLHVDGSLVGASASNNNSYLIGTMQIGSQSGGTVGPVNGYLDDVRLTIGTSRGYTGSTITVPTAAFPDA